MLRRILTVALAILTLAALMPAAAAGGPPEPEPEPEWFVDESKLPFDPLPGFEDATLAWGVLEGAGYRIEVPANWNGRLVMWAHGFRGTGLELTVDNHPLREFLIPNGYAWAASSYSANDYNVSAGVKDTRLLVRKFRRMFGEPDLTYITGASMGGHITGVSVEAYPNVYDGALPICGVMGDFELFDYFLDFNVAGQQLALGESAYPVPDPLEYIAVTSQQIKAELEAVPGGWPVALNATGEGFKQLVELQSGGDRPNFDEAWAFWNSVPEFGSGIPGNFLFDLGAGDGTLPGREGIIVDNTDTVYQLDLDPALNPAEIELNANIVRVAADPFAREAHGLSNVPPISGDISMPVLSLHNLGDLFVPFHNQVVYANEVAYNGASDLLVQRAIRGVGHCDFTPTELVTAFVDLVGWVEFGVKPEGDVVRDPAAVAAPDYGCKFTDFATGTHLLPAPCP